MQIKRIKEIKNIGTFASFTNGASVGFEKLTFIYGFNTFGKTTLADIFQSLKNDDKSIILERKTIPEIGTSQKVTISAIENETNEDEIIFNGEWSANQISKHLEVFGTDFIHKNVFTGLTFQRSNKENLTNFILGDQGVQLAEKIRNKKQTLGEKKKDLREKTPQHVKKLNETEISKFIDFDTKDLKLSEVDYQLTDKKNLLQKEENRLKEPAKITNLPEPNLFEPKTDDLFEKFKTLNSILEKSYADIKEDSIQRLNSHVLNNFTYTDNSRNWIKQGIDYCKNKDGGDCPFCGQNLNNVKELIDLYSSYFDVAYTNFIDEISTGLKINTTSLHDSRLNNKSTLQTILLRINQYKDLISDDDFHENLKKFETEIANLKEEEIETEKKKLLSQIETKIEEKTKSPYEKIESVDLSNFETTYKTYVEQTNNISTSIEFFSEKIKNLKQKYQTTKTIEIEILKLTNEITELEYKKARIEQNEDCIQYRKISKDISEVESGQGGIVELEQKLQEDQTTFLDKYFLSINQLFSKFGSKNFTLIKEEDNRGHMPVYSLKVKFHDKPIPADKISTVFSESDRRALALAIFFAHIELKEDDEKSKTIIILDDPITSFDDNRVINSINFFREIIDKCSQVIILTHYVHFIKRFCEIIYRQPLTVQFINITQNEFTSLLSVGEKNEFVSSDYEKVFMKIYGFINRKHSNSIKTDLRPFLENMYLPTVFNKKIHDNNIDCSNLDSMIDGIFDDNEDVRNKFHQFRTSLNPDSHIFSSSNPEDVRNFADDMFKCLYSIKIFA